MVTTLAWRYFDWGASLLWAVGGARVAARRGFDFTGIFAIALVTSAGGGLLRDLLLQQGPPLLVRAPVCIALAAAASLAIWLLGDRFLFGAVHRRVEMVSTAVGLGGFAVVGMDLALRAQVSLPGVMLVGVANAVGGSVLQALMLQEAPEAFKPGELSALAALFGCAAHLTLTLLLHVDAHIAAFTTVGLVTAVRLGSIRFRIHTRSAIGYRPPAAPGDGM